MDRTELYLQTAFCCMACDGDISPEEISLIRQMSCFKNLNLKQLLDDYVGKLKKEGSRFLLTYLVSVKDAELTEDEECELANIAIQTIEADEKIEYNEVAFFKKIRRLLKSSDERLLKIIPENTIMPDREYYLLPDISDENDFSLWTETFTNMGLALDKSIFENSIQ